LAVFDQIVDRCVVNLERWVGTPLAAADASAKAPTATPTATPSLPRSVSAGCSADPGRTTAALAATGPPLATLAPSARWTSAPTAPASRSHGLPEPPLWIALVLKLFDTFGELLDPLIIWIGGCPRIDQFSTRTKQSCLKLCWGGYSGADSLLRGRWRRIGT
jgi:hypothetical protein